MMYDVLIAAAVMIIATLAHHLGFVEKAYEEARQIVGCVRCTVFWTTLLVLTIVGHCHLFVAVGLSFICSYAAIWLELFYDKLAKIYERIWQRQQKQRREK